MTTTSAYQKKPNYYKTKKDCKDSVYKKINTNPRYKFFYQTHFTAGDEEQFYQYRDARNGQICIENISLKNNKFADKELYKTWGKNKNLNPLTVSNTFQYIFNKFKKGIFVKIQNGNLKVFLPFSKKNFVNEWSNRIKVNPKFGNINNFIKYISNKQGRKFNPKHVNKFTNNWYANNCLVRYEFPINEGDTNVPIIHDMLEELCKKRKIPDIEFFINRRDFPIITRDETEPYDNLYDSVKQPLLSHLYNKYSPILSMVTTDRYADIPIPTGDDWSRISRLDGKFFPRSCKEYDEKAIQKISWDDKKPVAVFRGGSTGCGVTPETNMRLKIALLSSKNPKGKNGQQLLDAGITNWNLRPRKLIGEKYLETIEIENIPFNLVEKLTPEEQAKFKYIVNIDGHVSAFRLSLELSMGCVILLVNSPYSMWYRKLLQPWVHYVPVKENLSDLLERVEWCQNNDSKCKEIATNALNFYKKYLQKDGALDYMQKILFDIKKKAGIYLYNEITPLDVQIKYEKNCIYSSLYHPKTKRTTVYELPNQNRCYGLLQGLEWVCNLFPENIPEFRNKTKLFENNNTKITKGEFYGVNVVVKQCLNSQKFNELYHETFVAKFGINILLKEIPNFMYCFGIRKEKMIMEYRTSFTLSDYIKSDKFNMKEFIFILIQVCMALQVSQNKIGFVHYDLTPWNILVEKIDNPIDIMYNLGTDGIYKIKTTIIPYIIDYGKAHFIYKNRHYGMVNLFKTSTVQDIFSLLVTSIYDISVNNQKLTDKDTLLLVANFLTGGQFHPKKFFNSKRNGLLDLSYFLKNVKKYTEILNIDKKELENYRPIDFINYIKSNINYENSIQKSPSYTSLMNKGNPKQVFNYSISKSNKKRRKSYIDVFKNFIKCDLKHNKRTCINYYCAQTFYTNLNSVFSQLKNSEYYRQNEDDFLFTKVRGKIDTIYWKYLEIEDTTKIPLKENKANYTLISASYNKDTFLFPEKIKKLLETGTRPENDIFPYSLLLNNILSYSGPFEIPVKQKNYYYKKYRDLIRVDPFAVQTHSANYNSLYHMAVSIYKEDRDVLVAKLKNEGGNCKDVERYLQKYNEIV